ncbi:MAG: restriction endonuclease [Planctomycetota bacterium]
MLTATEVHYLVGLLTQISSPENVEIILGDMVQDNIADKKRDVDITVTYKDANGLISAFKGIEVKRHSRPLDVTHVEQLSAKLNDMPDLSHRGIVSASGYTEPAKKKAEAHGVDLFSLIQWYNTMEGFEHIRFPPGFCIKEMILIWAGRPLLTYNPSENIPDETRDQITKNTSVSGVAGSEDNSHITIQQLSDRLNLNALTVLKDREDIKSLAPGAEKQVKCLLKGIDGIYVNLKDSKLYLKQALLQGKVKWNERSISPEFKILIKEGELKPYVGCAIAELSQGNLIGFTVSQVDRALKLINIPLSERNREKIKLIKLR